MVNTLMGWYGRTPPRVRALVRHWIVMPGKRWLSRGVISQQGFVLAKRLDQSIPFKLWREGNYEPELSALFRSYLRPGDTLIDVGANVGYFTLLAAACVGPTGRVYSFEPNPAVFRELERNVALNRFSHVILNNVALSNRTEKVTLWIAPEMDSGLSSLRATNALLTEARTVQAVPLDDYVESNRCGKIRAMKMDVEGAEHLVLEGAQKLLSGRERPDLIALEAVQSHAAAFHTTTAAIAQMLAKQDYRLHTLGANGSSFQLRRLDSFTDVPDGTLIATVD